MSLLRPETFFIQKMHFCIKVNINVIDIEYIKRHDIYIFWHKNICDIYSDKLSLSESPGFNAF